MFKPVYVCVIHCNYVPFLKWFTVYSHPCVSVILYAFVYLMAVFYQYVTLELRSAYFQLLFFCSPLFSRAVILTLQALHFELVMSL